MTLHRPALVDDPTLLAETLAALSTLSEALPVLFPVHPRTAARLEESGDGRLLTEAGVRVKGPLGYLDFVGLEAEAAFVLTDSGGVQEETSARGVPASRSETQRRIPGLLATQKPPTEIPRWDGRAGERGAAVLAVFLANRPTAGQGDLRYAELPVP